MLLSYKSVSFFSLGQLLCQRLSLMPDYPQILPPPRHSCKCCLGDITTKVKIKLNEGHRWGEIWRNANLFLIYPLEPFGLSPASGTIVPSLWLPSSLRKPPSSPETGPIGTEREGIHARCSHRCLVSEKTQRWDTYRFMFYRCQFNIQCRYEHGAAGSCWNLFILSGTNFIQVQTLGPVKTDEKLMLIYADAILSSYDFRFLTLAETR